MNALIDAQTRDALALYSDAALDEFRRRLAEKRFCSTRCKRCREIAFPPRSFCPHCAGREVEWVDLPRRGKLYAFTQQQRGLRFLTPDVIGLVELEGVGHFLSRVDAPFEKLALDQTVEVDFLEVVPGVWMHQFRPI